MPRFETLWARSSGPPGEYPRYYHLTNDCDYVLRQAEPGTSYEVWREGRWQHYFPSEQDYNSLRALSPAEAITRVAVAGSRAKVE
jgi:hypothetical protein